MNPLQCSIDNFILFYRSDRDEGKTANELHHHERRRKGRGGDRKAPIDKRSGQRNRQESSLTRRTGKQRCMRFFLLGGGARFAVAPDRASSCTNDSEYRSSAPSGILDDFCREALIGASRLVAIRACLRSVSTGPSGERSLRSADRQETPTRTVRVSRYRAGRDSFRLQSKAHLPATADTRSRCEGRLQT